MIKIHSFLFLSILFGITANAQKNSQDEYPAVTPDLKIAVSSADASSAQWGEEAAKSIDGNMNTLYHSSWSNTKFPVTINYHFKNVNRLDYFTYPRSGSGSNGNFMEIEVWVSTVSKPEFVRTGRYNFEGKNSPSIVHFPGGLKSPRTVRIIVHSGMGEEGNGFASCAEMMFYEKKKQTEIPTVFTDETCSKLRSGLKKQDIDTIRNTFYRNLASALLDKTYPEKLALLIKYR
jgi:hypothetical protein